MTHRHHTNKTLLQTVKNFKKSFQNETKQIKNMKAQNTREQWEEKWLHG